MPKIVVARDGSGDYSTIQEAVDAVRVHMEEPHVICIRKGVYKERVTVPENKPNIRFVGENAAETVLTFDLYAEMKRPDGKKLGTFGTPVLTVAADRFRAEHLTVQNTAGYGPSIGQAVAVSVSGDQVVFANCRLLGNQDTLYTAKGRHYFRDCYIEGHVDFIFGAATAVFDRCEIASLRDGYIVAPSTTEDTRFGYVFLNCRLTGPAKPGTVFLGRPWRPYGHTVFVNTWMGPHIRPEGWDNWRNPANEKTARFAEYASTGPGAQPEKRAGWAKLLDEAEAAELRLSRIFAGTDAWTPGQEDDE